MPIFSFRLRTVGSRQLHQSPPFSAENFRKLQWPMKGRLMVLPVRRSEFSPLRARRLRSWYCRRRFHVRQRLLQSREMYRNPNFPSAARTSPTSASAISSGNSSFRLACRSRLPSPRHRECRGWTDFGVPSAV